MKSKSLDLNECDLKFSKDDDGSFEGYLSTFGSVDSYGDTIFKGAYVDTLTDRKRMPPMLLNHQAMSVPVGVWKSMVEDDAGLRVVGELTKGNSESQQVYAAMKHGAMTGLSIGYRAVDFKANEHGGSDFFKIDLREGSIVSMPAEDSARIDVVKYEDIFDDVKSVQDFEYALRDVGCSRSVAKKLCSQFKEICLRDVGTLEDELTQLKQKLSVYERIENRKSKLSHLERLVNKEDK